MTWLCTVVYAAAVNFTSSSLLQSHRYILYPWFLVYMSAFMPVENSLSAILWTPPLCCGQNALWRRAAPAARRETRARMAAARIEKARQNFSKTKERHLLLSSCRLSRAGRTLLYSAAVGRWFLRLFVICCGMPFRHYRSSSTMLRGMLSTALPPFSSTHTLHSLSLLSICYCNRLPYMSEELVGDMP